MNGRNRRRKDVPFNPFAQNAAWRPTGKSRPRGTARVAALVVRHVGERRALLEQAVLGFGRHLDMIPR